MSGADHSGALEQSLMELQQAAEKAELLLQQRPETELAQIDCGPGCGSCCVVNVSTLLPEGVAITRYVRQLPAQEQQGVVEGLEVLWREVRGLDDEERLVVRRKCAFLNMQGSCSIYPVRPLLCRSITSTDQQSCRDALDGAMFGEERVVLMNMYQQQLYEVLFIELAEKLEQRGVDGRSFQLSGLVRYLLSNPEVEVELFSGRRLDWQDIY